jgi:hypothetical protein
MCFCPYFKEISRPEASGDYRKYSQVLTLSFRRLITCFMNYYAGASQPLSSWHWALVAGIVVRVGDAMLPIIKELRWVAQMVLIVWSRLPERVLNLL